MDYEFWTTALGSAISVDELTDLHLLNIIHALAEGRLYKDDEERRKKWLIVMQAEAITRDLDFVKKPTERIDLVTLLFGDMAGMFISSVGGIRKRFADLGVPVPEVDVATDDGRVTYLHWRHGEGVGTPTGNSSRS